MEPFTKNERRTIAALFIAIVVSIVLLSLSGCALKPDEWTAPKHVVAEMTVQQAVVEYIDGKPERARAVVNLTNRLEELIKANPKVRSAELIAEAKAAVPWHQMSRDDIILAVGIFAVIEKRIDASVANHILSADQKFYLADLFDWIRITAIVHSTNAFSST